MHGVQPASRDDLGANECLLQTGPWTPSRRPWAGLKSPVPAYELYARSWRKIIGALWHTQMPGDIAGLSTYTMAEWQTLALRTCTLGSLAGKAPSLIL